MAGDFPNSTAPRTRPRDVRFGGRESPGGWRFELSGGHPALDFVNTLDERRTDVPQERLRHFDDLVGFALQAGLMASRPAAALRRTAARQPAVAARCVRGARTLREHLFSLFCAAIGRAPLPAPALDALNAALVRAAVHRQLEPAPGGARWIVANGGTPHDALLSPLALAAAELLTSPAGTRVRRCGGRGCAWLFLDESRNGSRRWCDMTVCGNRAKAARHRDRLRASAG